MQKFTTLINKRVLEIEIEPSLKDIDFAKFFAAEKAIKDMVDAAGYGPQSSADVLKTQELMIDQIKAMYEITWQIQEKATMNAWGRSDVLAFFEKAARDVAFYFNENETYFKGFAKAYVHWFCAENESSVMIANQIQIWSGSFKSGMMKSGNFNTGIIVNGKHMVLPMSSAEDMDVMFWINSFKDVVNAILGFSRFAFTQGYGSDIIKDLITEYKNDEDAEYDAAIEKYLKAHPEAKEIITTFTKQYRDAMVNWDK